jgi:DNA methyltransferase 1-associated protein 1
VLQLCEVIFSLTPQKLLVEPTWTKEETDHLMDLAKTFDLRFIVIHDRFDSNKFQVK